MREGKVGAVMVTETVEEQLLHPYEAKKNLKPYFPPVRVALNWTIPDALVARVPLRAYNSLQSEQTSTKLGTTDCRLLWVKVNCMFPAETETGEAMASTGVFAVAEVMTELRTPPVGVVRLILKTSPEVEAGISTTKAAGVAEKMEGWMTAPFWVIVRAKIEFGQPLGSPDPDSTTLPPLVEMVEGVLPDILGVTVSKYALDSPMGSILIFTLYSPLSTLGSAKVTVLAVEAEGVALVTKFVFLLVRMTTGVPRLRFQPVRVMLPEEMELADMLVSFGDEAASMQENLQTPSHVLSTMSLLVSTTSWGTLWLQQGLMGGVLQRMSVVFTSSKSHIQFNSFPTKTKVSSRAGEKLIPLMWMRVPPLQLPEVGETELMMSSQAKSLVLVLLGMASPTPIRFTSTLYLPVRPPGIPTLMQESLKASTLILQTFPDELARSTRMAD